MSMTVRTFRISCTEDCLDQLRINAGCATHAATQHVEETGHACIVTPLEGDGWKLVDERTSSLTDRTGDDQDDREEVESAGRWSSQTAAQVIEERE